MKQDVLDILYKIHEDCKHSYDKDSIQEAINYIESTVREVHHDSGITIIIYER